jgi:hypothetical protein
MPSRALALAGKARLSLRDHGNPCWGALRPSAPPPVTPAPLASLGLASWLPTRLFGPLRFGEHGFFLLGRRTPLQHVGSTQ